VKQTGARIIIVFEERDAAGKGGTIKALTERVSRRIFRTMAKVRRPGGAEGTEFRSRKILIRPYRARRTSIRAAFRGKRMLHQFFVGARIVSATS
jgi:thymidylate kinase